MNGIRTVLPACLLALATSALAAPPATAEAEFDPCDAIADAATRGTLRAFVIPRGRLASLDINHDGRTERVTFGPHGLQVFDRNGRPVGLTQANAGEWATDEVQEVDDYSLVRLHKRVYLLGKEGGQPRYLAQVDAKNVESLVCRFGVRTEPTETLVRSKNRRLCQAALARQMDYVKFDKHHAVPAAAIKGSGFDAARAGRLAAYADIDNDGKKEYLIGAGLSSGEGSTCDAVHLWALNDARNSQDAALTLRVPQWVCGGAEQSLFVFDGQTYLKVRGEEDRPAAQRVVQLKDGRLDEICRYDAKATYYVLGEYERILANAQSAHLDPWIYALNMPGTEGLRALMEAKHDLRIHVRADVFGTVVHEAIRRKKFRDLEFLLEQGADPNVTASDDANDPLNQPPLIFAIWASSVDATRVLLKHGADAELTWLGKPAKDWAALWVHSGKNRAAIMELLSAKQDSPASPGQPAQPPIARLTAAGD